MNFDGLHLVLSWLVMMLIIGLCMMENKRRFWEAQARELDAEATRMACDIQQLHKQLDFGRTA